MAPEEPRHEEIIAILVAMLREDPHPDDEVLERWKERHPDLAAAIDGQIAYRRRRERKEPPVLSAAVDTLLYCFMDAMGDEPPSDGLIEEWVRRHPAHETDLREFAEAAQHVVRKPEGTTIEDDAEARSHAKSSTTVFLIDMEVEAKLAGG